MLRKISRTAVGRIFRLEGSNGRGETISECEDECEFASAGFLRRVCAPKPRQLTRTEDHEEEKGKHDGPDGEGVLLGLLALVSLGDFGAVLSALRVRVALGDDLRASGERRQECTRGKVSSVCGAEGREAARGRTVGGRAGSGASRRMQRTTDRCPWRSGPGLTIFCLRCVAGPVAGDSALADFCRSSSERNGNL